MLECHQLEIWSEKDLLYFFLIKHTGLLNLVEEYISYIRYWNEKTEMMLKAYKIITDSSR